MLAACSLLGPTSGISGGAAPPTSGDATLSDGGAEVGNVDGAGPSAASFCQRNVDAFFCDDFDDGQLADKWNLVFDPPGSANRDAGLSTSTFRSPPNAAEFFRGANGGDVYLRRALGPALRGASCEFSFYPEAWTGWASVSAMRFGSTYGGFEVNVSADKGLCVVGGGTSVCGNTWDGRLGWRKFRVTIASAKEPDDAGANAGLRRVFVEDLEPTAAPSPHLVEERFVPNTDPYLLDVAFEIGAIDVNDNEPSPTHLLADDVACTVTP